ncbi:MAG: thiamine-phosphate kinase [Acidimicrobiales bacterium]
MATGTPWSGSEFEAIEAIGKLLGPPPPGQVWIGDDAAVLALDPGSGADPPAPYGSAPSESATYGSAPSGSAPRPAGPGPNYLMATDLVVAGVHGDLDLVGLDDLGWKALAVNVSDIAAMGGWPMHAVVSIAGPSSTDLELVYVGLSQASVEYECPIVGGDLSDAPSLVICVAITGTTRGHPALLRSGASVGDALFTTGPLGASAAGLARLRQGEGPAWPELVERHRRPRARVQEGQAARQGGASAMIDVSDGLAADLDHLGSRSNVGLVLDHVPVAPGASFDEALGGGEDYELVFSAPDPERVLDAFAAAGLRAPLVLGWCSADPTERRLGNLPLPLLGWTHRRG